MLLLSLASAALHLRPLTTTSAHGRHACVRLLSTDPGAASIALPKFLVTTVQPKSNADGKFVFNSKSKESSESPAFLVDVKYEHMPSVPGEWTDPKDQGKGKTWTEDKGLGEFSGRAISQAR